MSELTEAERRSLGCQCWRLDGKWQHVRGCPAPAVEAILSDRLAAVGAERDRAQRKAADYEGRYETAHASRMHAEDCYHREFARAEVAEAEVARLRAESAAQAQVLADVRRWAETYMRQWVPGTKPADYVFTFDMGVGAAAHDVLAALAPLDAPAEEECGCSDSRDCCESDADLTPIDGGLADLPAADLPAPTGANDEEAGR